MAVATSPEIKSGDQGVPLRSVHLGLRSSDFPWVFGYLGVWVFRHSSFVILRPSQTRENCRVELAEEADERPARERRKTAMQVARMRRCKGWGGGKVTGFRALQAHFSYWGCPLPRPLPRPSGDAAYHPALPAEGAAQANDHNGRHQHQDADVHQAHGPFGCSLPFARHEAHDVAGQYRHGEEDDPSHRGAHGPE
jgi:hypothetical protein